MQRHHWLNVLSAILLPFSRHTHPLEFHCFTLRHPSHPTPMVPPACHSCLRKQHGDPHWWWCGKWKPVDPEPFPFLPPPSSFICVCLFLASCRRPQAGMPAKIPNNLESSSHHRHIFCCNLIQFVRRQSHVVTRHAHIHTHGPHHMARKHMDTQ
ncbi:hypothetical protein CGRA01v4_10271 [Colletotrichum graminicola]|nr:hypothetical protein CGRA01v4_10271 [Colletotrichum graminicola]